MVRKSQDWSLKIGEIVHNKKQLVEFVGMYRPNSGGPKALFNWKCLRCDEIHGPTQYQDIKRNSAARCCSASSKYGSIRWGFKNIPSAYMRSLHISAAKRGLSFSITSEYLYSVWEKQSGCCAYTGIPLELGTGEASVDRIDSSKGYIEGNVQWVLTKVNRMKWDSSEKEFLELCSLIVKSRKE